MPLGLVKNICCAVVLTVSTITAKAQKVKEPKITNAE
jgi:hypothetical protein